MIRTIPDDVIVNEFEADKLFDFLSEVSTSARFCIVFRSQPLFLARISVCMQRLTTISIETIQSPLLSKYLEGHTESVLLIRGTYCQYWLN